MAFIQLLATSENLKKDVNINVITPERGEEPSKVLYLLHGLGGDHSSWMRKTSIERYAKKYNLTVIMPSADRSWYADEKQGYPYYTFIAKELPQIIEHIFNISTKREDTFIAGLSMGGYGAMRIALADPNKFSKAATLSGTVNIKDRVKFWPSEEFVRIFGEDGPTDADDPICLLDECAKASQRPVIYQACGTNDRLYGFNQQFKEKALALGYDLTYTEEPETHNWGYWDRQINLVLEWLFKNDIKEQEE